MSRRRRASEPEAVTARPLVPRLAGPRQAAAILAATILLSSVAVDLRAESSFDSPKRLVSAIGTLLAAGLLFGRASWSGTAPIGAHVSRIRPLERLLLAASVLGCIASALVSPRPALAIDGLRGLALGALLLALGASSALDDGRARPLAIAFVVGCTLNAVASLLQLAGLRLFPIERMLGRANTGAFLGNDGYVGLLLAFGSVIALAAALAKTASVRTRTAAASFAVLFFSGIAANRSVTAFIAFGAGAGALFLGRFRRRAVAPLLGLLLVASGLVAAWPPLRHRMREVANDALAGNWEPVLSYRFGPWSAAGSMMRERPLLGMGPATFAAEYVPHRLSAELRKKARYVNPFLPGDAYAEAHSDILQSFAEVGIPVALASLLLFGLVVVRLVLRVRRAPAVADEALALLALLIAGAAAASTWFPFHREFSSVPLLLAIGRAWRVSRSEA
ncbi:MAG: O-antigen ligase family protein [Thermoanaerobaculia bacterium]